MMPMGTGSKLFLWLSACWVVPWTAAEGSELYSARIFSGTQAVAAVTCGDFDPVHAGREVACLMANGSILELALGPSGLTTNTIFQYPGGFSWDGPSTRVSLGVGDVLPASPGEEIVVSLSRKVFAVYRLAAGGSWTNQVVADLTDYIGTAWGAEPGDCDPSHAGDEVFYIFEGVLDFSSGAIYGRTNGGWKQNDVYYAEVGMDAAIGDTNPGFVGNEIIVVTEMGPAYEILPPPAGGVGPWPKRTIWDDFDNAGWVAKVAEVDPASPGNELVYGTRYSDRILLSRYNGTNRHQVDILLTGNNTNHPNSMFDVAVGQVFPATPTAEILGVDGSGSVYLVGLITNQWQGQILWQDSNALHSVLAADLIPMPGDEVIVAGASGAVTLLYNPASLLNLSLTAQQQAVLSWPAVTGWTYSIEATTNFSANPIWTAVTNLSYSNGFSGTLTYTNSQPTTHARWFRVKLSMAGEP